MLARGEALFEAYELALFLAPEAVLQKTGYALGEVLKGLLPGLIQMVLILGATTSLGAAVGGVIGFFFGGVGAAPGAVVGGELGFDIGTAILTWIGVGFLAKAVVEGLGEIWAHISAGVTIAWAAPEYPQKDYPRQIKHAAQELADAVGMLVLVILQAAVAYVLKRAAVGATKAAVATGQTISRVGSEAAADETLAALLQQLRKSQLGPSFADWVEKNWAKLKDDPRLRFRARPPGARTSAGGSTAPPLMDDGPPKAAEPEFDAAKAAANLRKLSPAEARKELLRMPYDQRVKALNAMVDDPALLNVKTAPNRAVFYSGRAYTDGGGVITARSFAETRVGMDGKTILESTEGGRYLDEVKVYDGILESQDADMVWTKLSGRYADSASGDVVVYKGDMRPGAVLNHELEVLEQKQAAGSVTSIKIYELDDMLSKLGH